MLQQPQLLCMLLLAMAMAAAGQVQVCHGVPRDPCKRLASENGGRGTAFCLKWSDRNICNGLFGRFFWHGERWCDDGGCGCCVAYEDALPTIKAPTTPSTEHRVPTTQAPTTPRTENRCPGGPRKRCKRKGNEKGVTAFCLPKQDRHKCKGLTGRFYAGRNFCYDASCGCCVPNEGCPGGPRKRCKRKGIQKGVNAYCLPKQERDKCEGLTGTFYPGRNFCYDASCGCCVPN